MQTIMPRCEVSVRRDEDDPNILHGTIWFRPVCPSEFIEMNIVVGDFKADKLLTLEEEFFSRIGYEGFGSRPTRGGVVEFHHDQTRCGKRIYNPRLASS